MAVTADSYEARVVAAAVTMLTATAAWQTATGSASATASRAYVVESDGDDLQDDSAVAVDGSTIDLATADCWAVVHLLEHQTEVVGLGVERHSGQVGIRLVLRDTAGDAPPERIRRSRNIAGNIRAQLLERYATSGALARGHVTLEGPGLPPVGGPEPDTTHAYLILHWST